MSYRAKNISPSSGKQPYLTRKGYLDMQAIETEQDLVQRGKIFKRSELKKPYLTDSPYQGMEAEMAGYMKFPLYTFPPLDIPAFPNDSPIFGAGTSLPQQGAETSGIPGFPEVKSTCLENCLKKGVGRANCIELCKMGAKFACVCGLGLQIVGSPTVTTNGTFQYDLVSDFCIDELEFSDANWYVRGTGASISSTGLLTTSGSACGMLVLEAEMCGTLASLSVMVSDNGSWQTITECGTWLIEGIWHCGADITKDDVRTLTQGCYIHPTCNPDGDNCIGTNCYIDSGQCVGGCVNYGLTGCSGNLSCINYSRKQQWSC